MDKLILHLDMDAFFASVEQAVNIKLKGKPVIVGSRADKYRTVVAACSYEAKARGCASGMSAKEAFRLCPEAIFMPADSTKYIYTAQKIFKLLSEFSPQVEMSSIDEFYLDITGCQKLFGSTEQLARIIKQKIVQQLDITGSIGVAPNRLMAKLASKADKPDGLVIWKREDLENILEDMPVEKICGIGPKITVYLQEMSIFTCGQLANTPSVVLKKRFGKYGLWLNQAARGEDSDIVELYTQTKLPPKSVGHSYTLERNISKIELIKAWLRVLCEMVAQRLRNLLLEGSVVHLYLRGPDLQWWSKQKSFSEATFDGKQIYQRSLIILNSLPKQLKLVRALGVTVSKLIPTNPAYLFEQDIKRQELLLALDQINARFGDQTIYPAQFTITAS
ncbi:DNA polymerase IV [Candidatus Omnitrophota bacterium]